MIEVREVRLDSHPSNLERFFEPVVSVSIGRRLSSDQVSHMIVWLLTHPGCWLRWSNGANWPVSAEPLNHESFDKWRGFAGDESERGLWVRFNRTGE